MALTEEQKIEFSFLTRKLGTLDLNVHLTIAKSGCERINKGLEFEDRDKAYEFLRNFMHSYAIVRTIADAAQKFTDQLKDEFKLAPAQLKACIEIRNDLEGGKMKGSDQATLFKPQKHAPFAEEEFRSLFEKLTAISPGPKNKH